ncbi:MAG: OmpA family protein, partial [Pyrinomonadaceae bacterium]
SKLNDLAAILATSTDYKVTVESHTDNKGTPDELQTLTDARAQAISGKLTAGGVDTARVEAKGFGASLPVAPNTTNLDRAKNRRVEIILTPIIGQ